ncbi:CBS domain-containing protein [Candidatus Altiarchaeota archaeon]
MSHNGQRYSDVKGHQDRGPREFQSRHVDKDGEIMNFASSNVISTNPMNTIKNVAAMMSENDVRRLPVIDAGTDRLQGLAAAIDIMDFMSGGEKYNILLKDYDGNFLKAINSRIDKIMGPASHVNKKASVEDALTLMLEARKSCIPIVEDEESLKVTAVTTERDLLPHSKDFGVTVSEVMKSHPLTSSLGMMIGDVAKIMVRNRLRRLPVIQEDTVIGVVTVFDILDFIKEGHFTGIKVTDNLATRVDEVMEKKVVSVHPENDLSQVSQQILETGYGGFPVTVEGRLEGIITTTDVLRWVYRES